MKVEPRHEERIRALRFAAFDFDGVFTDNGVWVSGSGEEIVRCSRLDGIGLDALRRIGIGLAVVSSEVHPVVGARCEKLRLRCVQACRDKVAAVRMLASDLGSDLGRTAFVGNDINDLEVLEAVGLPVIVADAHPSLAGRGFLQTARGGGHGAVREFCDLVAVLRGAAGIDG
jgi:YrbI family 3-deoxy-D-manno-octulosonate 8-phosphate phosphatase